MKNIITLLLVFCSLFAEAQTQKDTLVVPPHIKVIVIDGVAYDERW
jgi:hypothetical protein